MTATSQLHVNSLYTAISGTWSLYHTINDECRRLAVLAKEFPMYDGPMESQWFKKMEPDLDKLTAFKGGDNNLERAIYWANNYVMGYVPHDTYNPYGFRPFEPWRFNWNGREYVNNNMLEMDETQVPAIYSALQGIDVISDRAIEIASSIKETVKNITPEGANLEGGLEDAAVAGVISDTEQLVLTSDTAREYLLSAYYVVWEWNNDGVFPPSSYGYDYYNPNTIFEE